MRKIALTLAAAAGIVGAASLSANRAEATILDASAAFRQATGDTSLAQPVNYVCRWSYWGTAMLVAARLRLRRLRVSPALLRLLWLPAALLGSVGLALPALGVLSSAAFAGSAPPRFPLGDTFALSERGTR